MIYLFTTVWSPHSSNAQTLLRTIDNTFISVKYSVCKDEYISHILLSSLNFYWEWWLKKSDETHLAMI